MSAGTIAVTADLAARYTVFAVCLERLQKPPGTQVRWHLGSDVAANRNRAVEQMEGDFLLFLDDDHAFAPDLLLSLLAHDVDIVQPLCLRRSGSFLPVASIDDDFLDLTDQPDEGLIEVQHAGSAGMLIRRRVFETLEPPWFELRNGVSEDVTFCQKAAAAGFPIHLDLGSRLGHVTTAVVWPTYQDDEWRTGFQFADGSEISMERATSEEMTHGRS